MITKYQECFHGTDGHCNVTGLLSQQKLKLKPKDKHTYVNKSV